MTSAPRTTSSTSEAMPAVDGRIQMAALWAATMFIFVFVDVFALYREDFRASIESGTVATFDIGQPFLIGITLYAIIPSLMVYLAVSLPRRANRIVNIVVASVFALTIVGSAIGETWIYYLIASVVELALLGLVIRRAATWRALASATS